MDRINEKFRRVIQIPLRKASLMFHIIRICYCPPGISLEANTFQFREISETIKDIYPFSPKEVMNMNWIRIQSIRTISKILRRNSC